MKKLFLIQKPGTMRMQLARVARNGAVKIGEASKTAIARALTNGKQVTYDPERNRYATQASPKAELCGAGCITKARMLRGQAMRTMSLTRNKNVIATYQTYIASLDAVIATLTADQTRAIVFPSAPWEG